MSGVDPGVDPTHTPGVQSPLAAAGRATVWPPLLAQADMAKPSTVIAQMPIAHHDGWLLLFCGKPHPD
jgi:hypothetical protein